MDEISFVIDTAGSDSVTNATINTDTSSKAEKASGKSRRLLNLRNRSVVCSTPPIGQKSVVHNEPPVYDIVDSDQEGEVEASIDPSESNNAASQNTDSDSDDEFLEAAKVKIGGFVLDGRGSSHLTSIKPCLDYNDTYINLSAYKETTNFKKSQRKKKREKEDMKENDSRCKSNATSLTGKYDSTDKLLKQKSVICKPGFSAKPDPPSYDVAEREAKRRRKKQRDKTKGTSWYNLPAPELTDDKKNDLLLLKWRDALDPKRFYKRSDMKGLPKYFQVGTIVSNPAEYYSARVTKKQRKATIVDELLADVEFKQKVKKRHLDIMKMRKSRGGYKANRHMKRIKKKKHK